MLPGEGDEDVGQVQGGGVELEQAILEEESEIAGNLVVARAAGVQPLAHSGQAAGEPLLDR